MTLLVRCATMSRSISMARCSWAPSARRRARLAQPSPTLSLGWVFEGPPNTAHTAAAAAALHPSPAPSSPVPPTIDFSTALTQERPPISFHSGAPLAPLRLGPLAPRLVKLHLHTAMCRLTMRSPIARTPQCASVWAVGVHSACRPPRAARRLGSAKAGEHGVPGTVDGDALQGCDCARHEVLFCRY